MGVSCFVLHVCVLWCAWWVCLVVCLMGVLCLMDVSCVVLDGCLLCCVWWMCLVLCLMGVLCCAWWVSLVLCLMGVSCVVLDECYVLCDVHNEYVLSPVLCFMHVLPQLLCLLKVLSPVLCLMCFLLYLTSVLSLMLCLMKIWFLVLDKHLSPVLCLMSLIISCVVNKEYFVSCDWWMFCLLYCAWQVFCTRVHCTITMWACLLKTIRIAVSRLFSFQSCVFRCSHSYFAFLFGDWVVKCGYKNMPSVWSGHRKVQFSSWPSTHSAGHLNQCAE